jgi:hypothetical protein
MINSLFPIADRVYFLKKGNQHVEYRYSERFNTHSGRLIQKSISIQTDSIVIQHLLESMTLPYEKDVWNHAPVSMQKALLFSYAYHKHQKNRKVANVETINWLTIPYFSDLLALGKKKKNLFMTQGNHKKNLRVGHIHLTQDILDGKEISCIHWDIGASRLSPSILTHWMFDDMSS